jgi:hypothetical protein
MKKPLIAVGLTALVVTLSSPGMAQSQYPEQMRNYMRADTAPTRINGQALPDTLNGPHHEVVTSGRVVGADPDPTIRLEMLRENVGGDHW